MSLAPAFARPAAILLGRSSWLAASRFTALVQTSVPALGITLSAIGKLLGTTGFPDFIRYRGSPANILIKIGAPIIRSST
jgi:hypothetical protein